MKNKVVLFRSSFLVSLPLIVTNGILLLVTAFLGYRELSLAFMLFFSLSSISRLWAYGAGKKLSGKLRLKTHSLFPGDTVTVKVDIENDKFLPLSWLEIHMPLPHSRCLVPEETRESDEREVKKLAALRADRDYLGVKRCGSMYWYGRKSVDIPFKAVKRGIWNIAGWTFRTGDGFGLTQTELEMEGKSGITVYPTLVETDATLFLNKLWESNIGSHGALSDPTLIRSTRLYEDGDSAKAINWRLLARNLPMSVNIYEKVLPRSIHILFDGESFAGITPHFQEMENTISVIASLLVKLKEREMKCYLTFCDAYYTPSWSVRPEDGIEMQLKALAGYEPLLPHYNTEARCYEGNPSVFNTALVMESLSSVCHFYYFTWSASALDDKEILKETGAEKTTVIAYTDTDTESGYDVCPLGSLEVRRTL